MKLQLTRLDAKGSPALYVFAPDNGKGFIVASANDEGQALLGWSDTKTFSDSNLPTGLKWWLEARSRKAVAKATTNEFEAVTPICITTWNQDTPYNDQCPMTDDGRSVTGCVATAMAQIVKTYKYPTQGVGTHTCTWDYNNTKLSATVDFGAATYDWANMLDSYDSDIINYTDEEAAAVAQLIYHLGVAGDMIYSPEESDTNTPSMALGLIRNFGYDKSLTIESRDWYTQDEWDALVYAEIAQGYPLFYSGDSTGGGHAFVCDGYADGYFHINWGWGGICDGYFLLSDLDPESQGIGGSSTGDGYNEDQDIIYGVRPDFGTAAPTMVFALDGDLYTDKDKYDAATDQITVNSVVYNYTLADVTAIIALRLEDAESSEVIDIIPSRIDEFSMGNSISELTFAATNFPVGTYYISVCFADGSDIDLTDDEEADDDKGLDLDGHGWTEVRHNADATYRVLVTNDGETITVDNPERSQKTVATFDGFIPELEKALTVEQGKTYTVLVTITSTVPYEEDVLIGLAAPDEGGMIITSEPIQVALDEENLSKTCEFEIKFDVEPDMYRLLCVPASILDDDSEDGEDYDASGKVLGSTILQVEKSSGISAIEAADNTTTEVYNIGGVKLGSDITNLPAGLYIVKSRSTVTRIIKR